MFIGSVRRVVLRARLDRDAWILELEGLKDRQQVEALRGELLEAPDAEVIRDDDESYFVHELVGLRVIGTDGQAIGVVDDVLQSGAADVYVVKTATGELLVPAIADVISGISLRDGTIIITPLPGMLDESK